MDLFNPDKVAKRREEVGYTQQGLATKTGLSMSTIGLLEVGRKEPLVNTLAKIAWALKTDPGYFFGK